jgi:hypothetical protein
MIFTPGATGSFPTPLRSRSTFPATCTVAPGVTTARSNRSREAASVVEMVTVEPASSGMGGGHLCDRHGDRGQVLRRAGPLRQLRGRVMPASRIAGEAGPPSERSVL